MLVKLCEGKQHATSLRTFLVEHPLLVLELDFRLVLDPSQPYGFHVGHTVPGARHFHRTQQVLDRCILTDLLQAIIAMQQAEIPGLGETTAVNVKHLYAWVRENNPRQYVHERFDPKQQPTADPTARSGSNAPPIKSSPIALPKKSKSICGATAQAWSKPRLLTMAM